MNTPQGNLQLLENPKPTKKELWEQRQAIGVNGKQAMLEFPEETLNLIAYLFAQGLTTAEVSEKVNINTFELGRLKLSDTFQFRIVKHLRTRDSAGLQKMVRGALPDVILSMINLANNPGTPPATRLASCKSLMEFGVGKALPGKPLSTEDNQTISSDPLAEMDKLDREVSALNDQLNPTGRDKGRTTVK